MFIGILTTYISPSDLCSLLSAKCLIIFEDVVQYLFRCVFMMFVVDTQ